MHDRLIRNYDFEVFERPHCSLASGSLHSSIRMFLDVMLWVIVWFINLQSRHLSSWVAWQNVNQSQIELHKRKCLLCFELPSTGSWCILKMRFDARHCGSQIFKLFFFCCLHKFWSSFFLPGAEWSLLQTLAMLLSMTYLLTDLRSASICRKVIEARDTLEAELKHSEESFAGMLEGILDQKLDHMVQVLQENSSLSRSQSLTMPSSPGSQSGILNAKQVQPLSKLMNTT